MKIPLSPPDRKTTLENLLKQDPERAVEMMLGRQGSTDEKGRYFHWDKIRHLQPPEGLSSEEIGYRQRPLHPSRSPKKLLRVLPMAAMCV